MRRSSIAPVFLLLATLGAAAPAASQSPAFDATARRAALEDLTPENAVLVYVDFNTGLDNFLTTVPGPQFRENVRAYAGIGQVFEMPIALFGEENDYYGPFYPEIDPLRERAEAFHRTSPSGYTPAVSPTNNPTAYEAALTRLV